MAMRIVARNGPSYLIGDGDPREDNDMLASVVSLDGYLEPAVPFEQHLKWGDYELCPNDPELLKKLLARPKAPRHQGTP